MYFGFIFETLNHNDVFIRSCCCVYLKYSVVPAIIKPIYNWYITPKPGKYYDLKILYKHSKDNHIVYMIFE